MKKKLRSLRFALEYGAFRTMVAALRALGFERASAVNGRLWEIVAPLTRRHTAALRHLLVAFPDKTPQQREAIARAGWNNLGRTAAEAFMIDTVAREPSRVRLVSPDVLKAILETHKGKAVIAPMHSGNWEILAPAFTEYGLSGALIYQRVSNPYAENFLRETRLKYCPGGMYPKSDSAVRRLVSWLRGGNAVVILADQRAKGAAPVFFGHPAPSTPLPAYMARNFDAPLIACRVIRKPGSRFDLEFREVPVSRNGERDSDIAEATQALQSVFEGWIREYPEQWMWAHRRWSFGGPPKTWAAPQ